MRKGDVVGLVTQNDVDTPPVIFGALWAGAVISPANPQYTADELAFQLRDSGATLVVAHPASLAVVQAACAKVGIDKTRIILEGPRHIDSRFRHWRDIAPSKKRHASARPSIKPKEDIAYLVYSSGTTGKPKGVRLSHYNATSNVLQGVAGECDMMSWCGAKGDADFPPAVEGDKLIACLPFYHIYGLTLLIQIPLHQGLLCLVMAKFDLEKWCQLVEEQRVSLAFIVPPIAVLLAKHACVMKYDLTSLRICTSGAAPLSQSLIAACYERTKIRIKQGYGLSETSPILCTQKWHDWSRKAGSVGALVPNVEAKFCEPRAAENESSEAVEVPIGETGELYVRGPNIFQGYHNNSEATAQCLDERGWFRTGDVGHLDDEGNLHITDRVKELIKYNGFQVAPAELEGHLLEHDFVDDVVVVGVNSQVLNTEVPRAYVVRKGGLAAVEQGDDQRIITWLAGRVAVHKKLRGGVKFVEAIPKSAAGKLLRRLVQDNANREFARLEKSATQEKL